ncbi:hypothetical protein GQ53DRAFT_37775 [Thozetella sp. PMI_491]|nr:hypothetical protein GQ53DRAFT_37775 [Thozetella sp. PMI_491]
MTCRASAEHVVYNILQTRSQPVSSAISVLDRLLSCLMPLSLLLPRLALSSCTYMASAYPLYTKCIRCLYIHVCISSPTIDREYGIYPWGSMSGPCATSTFPHASVFSVSVRRCGRHHPNTERDMDRTGRGGGEHSLSSSSTMPASAVFHT